MKFDETVVRQLHLLFSREEDAKQLIDSMFAIECGEKIERLPASVRQTVFDLGWIDKASGELSELGRCAADSCREYKFWLQRDKALPFESGARHLSRDHFAGKSVVEIGCGMGANLMSLADTVDNLVGVEPVEAYVQFGSLLREHERMRPLDVRIGTAEASGFDDDCFDLVLCIHAHHYFDICAALREFSRILKPGGELLIVGDTLGVEMWLMLKAALHRPSTMKQLTVSVVNTLSYMAVKQRVIPARGRSTTSRPIFPLRGSMVRWLHDAGFSVGSPLARFGPDTCFGAHKSSGLYDRLQ